MIAGKPLRSDPAKVRAWLDRSRKPLTRGAFWKTRTGQLLRRTAMKQRNVERRARRAKQYRAVLVSDFHKQLRYAAYLRAGGLCECDRCVALRSPTHQAMTAEGFSEQLQAATPIPVWFTVKGSDPWRRFRSSDGEIHHDSYKHFGKENPDELRLLRWVWKTCHQRIEAEHNTRRHWLAGDKSV